MSEITNKKILENIHKLVTWHHGQNYLFNGCMQYLMECLGEDKEYDYWFFSGVTGDSFTQVHRPNYAEYTACFSQDVFDHDLAKSAFDACGYNITYVDEPELFADKPKYIKKVMEHIDRGMPVISRGCEGTGEFSVICGYENDGDTFYYLKGDDTEPTAYKSTFQCRLDLPTGLVFVGDKKQAPPIADVYRQAVLNIPSHITRAPKDGLVFGRAAFESWADTILDHDFSEMQIDANDTWKIHGTFLCIAGTNGCSRGFLKKALELNPDMEFIHQLLPFYEKQQMLFETMGNVGGGFDISPEILRSTKLKLPIANKIREFAICCDEILAVFDMLN